MLSYKFEENLDYIVSAYLKKWMSERDECLVKSQPPCLSFSYGKTPTPSPDCDAYGMGSWAKVIKNFLHFLSLSLQLFSVYERSICEFIKHIKIRKWWWIKSWLPDSEILHLLPNPRQPGRWHSRTGFAPLPTAWIPSYDKTFGAQVHSRGPWLPTAASGC